MVKPEVAILSAAYRNSHGHPRKIVVDRLTPHTVEEEPHRFRWAPSKTEFRNLDDFNEAAYSTATNGTIVITSDGESYSVEYSTRVRRDFHN